MRTAVSVSLAQRQSKKERVGSCPDGYIFQTSSRSLLRFSVKKSVRGENSTSIYWGRTGLLKQFRCKRVLTPVFCDTTSAVCRTKLDSAVLSSISFVVCLSVYYLFDASRITVCGEVFGAAAHDRAGVFPAESAATVSPAFLFQKHEVYSSPQASLAGVCSR